MAITFTPTDTIKRGTQGGSTSKGNEEKFVRGTVAFGTVTGAGDAIIKSQIGLSTITDLFISPLGVGATIAYLCSVDLTNNLVYTYKSAGSAAGFVSASGANLAAYSAIPFWAVGR